MNEEAREQVSEWVSDWVSEWRDQWLQDVGEEKKEDQEVLWNKKDRWGRTRLQTYFFNSNSHNTSW